MLRVASERLAKADTASVTVVIDAADAVPALRQSVRQKYRFRSKHLRGERGFRLEVLPENDPNPRGIDACGRGGVLLTVDEESAGLSLFKTPDYTITAGEHPFTRLLSSGPGALLGGGTAQLGLWPLDPHAMNQFHEQIAKAEYVRVRKTRDGEELICRFQLVRERTLEVGFRLSPEPQVSLISLETILKPYEPKLWLDLDLDFDFGGEPAPPPAPEVATVTYRFSDWRFDEPIDSELVMLMAPEDGRWVEEFGVDPEMDDLFVAVLGRRLPRLALRDGNGKDYVLGDLNAGRPLVLSVWTSEKSDFDFRQHLIVADRLTQEFGKGIPHMTVCMDTDPANTRESLRGTKLAVPTLFDPEGDVMWEVGLVFTTCVIDAAGVVQAVAFALDPRTGDYDPEFEQRLADAIVGVSEGEDLVAKENQRREARGSQRDAARRAAHALLDDAKQGSHW